MPLEFPEYGQESSVRHKVSMDGVSLKNVGGSGEAVNEFRRLFNKYESCLLLLFNE